MLKSKEEEKKQDSTEGEIIRFTVRARQNVSWEVGTIDNENMGKRKSKGKSSILLKTL